MAYIMFPVKKIPKFKNISDFFATLQICGTHSLDFLKTKKY